MTPRGMAVTGRPGDLGELWARAAHVGFGRAFTEFLDEFYSSPSEVALATPPPEGVAAEYRAFLAAAAETLALDFGLPAPSWAFDEILPQTICWEEFRKAIPAESVEEMRPIITRQTPTVFRQHGISVRANILKRT